MPRRLATVALVSLAFAGAASAGSWLTGSSAYEQAIAATAAARWGEAARLVEAATAAAEEGRVDWLRRLLEERAEGEASGRAVAHAYAYHNFFNDTGTTETSDALVAEAAARAEEVYQRYLGSSRRVDEALRWAYAGLLHELDREAEAAAFLRRTGEASSWRWSAGGPPGSSAGVFTLGYQMLLAYYHTARGDADAAMDFLEAARRRDPVRVVQWARESDDFWRLRDDPRYQAFLGVGR